MSGTLYGVGLGPGDPDLVTVRAARVIEEADVVAFHAARHGRSIARATASSYMSDGQIEELLVYPLTVEETDHPGGYEAAIEEFYAEAAERLAAHLRAGRDVALCAAAVPDLSHRVHDAGMGTDPQPGATRELPRGDVSDRPERAR